MYKFIFNSPLLFVETKIGMKSYSMTQLNGCYNSKLYIYIYIEREREIYYKKTNIIL